ncbi:stalk domain-containing protein [Paenibacillus sp. CAU 1782]
MKFRKVAIWLMLLSLWGGSMIFANTASQKVRVIVNGAESDEGGVLIEGRSYLPLRQMAVTLGAMLDWDNSAKKAVLSKPNVHMFMYNGNSPFGMVDRGYQGKIKVFAQIDNVTTDISAVKITMTDPSGKERLIESKTIDKQSDNFWFVTQEFDYKFDATGKYTVKFHMKQSSTDEWFVVSEKLITSIPK